MHTHTYQYTLTVAVNAVINALATVGQFEAALTLMQEMSNEGIVPNVGTWCAVMDACGNAGEWSACKNVFVYV